MIKQKLISKRKERGYSQEEMANALNADLEEIYEPHDGIYIINNENASGEYSGSQNHFHTIPGYILESMQKYIEKLEEENTQLKKKWDS